MDRLNRIIAFAFMAVVLSLFSKAMAGYSPNAFVIQNESSYKIITNQDINCVKITAKNTASIKLTAEARRFFYHFTEKNKGKPLTTML